MGSVTFLFLCCVTITLPACAFGCKGRVILTESSGVISDGDQEHPNYARCEWLIDAGDDNKVIYLEFDSLNTECSYDFLFIFDGDSYQSPKLASLSGYNSPEPILSTGGKMLIYLFSDRNYKREGFRVRYLIQDCPLNCSGNGHCIDHVCVCDTQFTGRGCETEICPGDCGAHGICDNSDSVRGCKCDPGYSGYLCNISLNDAAGSEYWYTIAPTGSQFEARSAHAGTFLYHTNCLYIFGGFTLNDILNDLKKFCLEENKWENITQMDPWPDGRYEHAIVAYKYGFYMFGGVLDQGYSNELWFYNATSESWRLCAENSTIIPPKLSGHTLSLVEEDLYLFGGKTEDGSFKSDIYKINADEPEDWVTVIPYGGKSAVRRLVGHSAVYHRESRSLLIFGGYSHSQDQPRFGTHTEKIHAFNIDNKIWSHLQPGKRDAPSQRSFHSALIMGNYMVVYGGNTHIHHDNELCFDYEIYLYHLGCHSWVRVSNLMGKYAEELRKKQPRGRVSHVAVAAYGNLLLVVGGFSGYVKGDLMAFKFPSYVAPPQTEATLDLDFCSNYTRIDKCGYNPECFYCNNISTTNMEGCIHRTQNHLCRETKTYYPKADCPGICSSLKTCQECLSQGQGASLTEHSPEKWTYIQPCNWCVKNAQCQRRSDPERTCKDGKDTESGIIGWWGGKSASLSQLSQCAAEDFPAGLQAIKYRPAVNIRQPDEKQPAKMIMISEPEWQKAALLQRQQTSPESLLQETTGRPTEGHVEERSTFTQERNPGLSDAITTELDVTITSDSPTASAEISTTPDSGPNYVAPNNQHSTETTTTPSQSAPDTFTAFPFPPVPAPSTSTEATMTDLSTPQLLREAMSMMDTTDMGVLHVPYIENTQNTETPHTTDTLQSTATTGLARQLFDSDAPFTDLLQCPNVYDQRIQASWDRKMEVLNKRQVAMQKQLTELIRITTFISQKLNSIDCSTISSTQEKHHVPTDVPVVQPSTPILATAVPPTAAATSLPTVSSPAPISHSMIDEQFADIPLPYRIPADELMKKKRESQSIGNFASSLTIVLFPELFTGENLRFKYNYNGIRYGKETLDMTKKSYLQRYMLYFYPHLSDPKAFHCNVIDPVNEILRRKNLKVKIIRETTEAENFRHIYTRQSLYDRIKWTGFIHPLNATIKFLFPNSTVIYSFKLMVENVTRVNLSISKDDTIAGLETIVQRQLTQKLKPYEFDRRPSDHISPIFPNISRGCRYYIDIHGMYQYPQHTEQMSLGQTMYRLELEWNGIPATANSLRNYHTFTSEFLEPYSNGNCDIHNNCLGCMTDALCAWCDVDQSCVLRNATAEESMCVQDDSSKMLVTDGGVCPVCDDHVECLSCAQDPLCEWVKDGVVCVRRGRVNITQKVVTLPEECPAACHGRSSCSECLQMRECAWCENLHTCLPFSDYVSRHRHGQCTEWIDSEEATKNPYTCRNCSAKKTCEMCLDTFSCGWCGNTANPTKGVCAEGDFSGPYGNITCEAIVSKVYRSVPINESADWSYSMCPDVEECLLGLARCHKNATCINTPTSYNCTCNRGYVGDGFDSCDKTCYYKCGHGICLEDPPGEFFCDCNLGWTGVDCAQDCLCNGHSMCESGPGQCDYCDNNTTGEHCEQCKAGHFGDPSKPDGCYECRCNGHGDPELGVCHNETGACFCVDNTFGFECPDCLEGYYGDPHDGGKCYLSCDHGMIVENITRGSLGSHQGPGVSTWKAYCLWIMTVAQDLDRARSLTDPPTITVDIEDLAVECERDHVYVYDGTPEFVDSRGDGILLGAFCGFYTRALQSVTTHSGIITIYFHADISGNYSSSRGFNASYYVNDCEDSCSANENKHCLAGQCVCKPGYTGDDCSNKSCQTGCTYDELTASCECEANFGGRSYQVSSFPWVPTATGADSPSPVSRYGHTIIHCDDTVMYVFGGRSLEHGLLNDIWLYDFETQTWTEIRPITSDQPAGRYFHAGACVPVRKNLYIFGGLVQSKGGNQEYEASKEMWKFAIDARKWTGPIQPSWVMGLAGHSMTLVEETILVIIGGFSTTKYFSDTVYEFDANIYLAAWQTHKWDNITGAKPTGIYGHSAVYNEVSKTIYIYGGHVYRQERLFISDRLFTYDIINKSWNILQPEKNSKVEPRYFHTAVGFNDYMAIMGGYTQHRNNSDKILIYKFRCNYWYLLDFSGTPMGKVLTSLVAAKSILYENSMVITGGYNNMVHSLVYKITLPEDLCTLSSDFNTCTLVYGCEARVVHHSNGENVTLCNRNDRPAPESTLGPVVQTNSGTVCNYNWHAQRDCQSITECSECIAVYPQFKSIEQSCHWCSKCSIGKCIARHKDCKATGENKCQVTVREPSDQVSQRTKMSCQVPCLAATCDRCSQMGCIWSQHFKRVLYSAGEVKWKQSLSPIFDWSCVLKSLKKNLAGYPVFVVPTDTCPAPCYVHSTCAECLDSWGGEGGSQECYWSETLNECMPPAYLSLRCLAGECGTILQGSAQKCPKPCDVHKKCGDCRKAPGCGWCAFGGLNGLGVCMSGTRSGPRGQCDVNNVSYEDRAMAEEDIEVFMRSKTAPSWAYATCPPEDECSNGHHSCNVDTQNCKDTLEGYICECKEGYIWNEDDAECKPVCHQGCVPNQGVCILPDTCQCYFGFVGKNCSTECECNRHSNCRSVEHKNDCLDCKNNTQGKYCQECKPLFVGNPKDGGKCVSCTEFCNNHTDICLYWAEYNDTYDKIQKLREKFPDTTSPEFHTKIADYLPKGPSEEGKTYCVDCQHHTFRSRCDECKLGYFRLTSMTPSEPCTKCMCNGHSDICDQKGGLNCVCKNKTETKCSAEVKLKMACYEVQCAVCKEYFLGTPTDGHQCYRQMNVNREYCFDPITQNDCTRSPDPLLHGRTVFFAVQPKYMNVDIRVTIDVTQGGMDVYFSPRDNTFTVDVDKITGVHTVRLDSNERFISLEEQLRMQASGHGGGPSARNIRSLASNSTIIRDYNSYVMHEKKANDLNTFITVTNSDTILLIRNVQYRLVITLPCDLLDLRTSRFYIIFLSTGDGLRNETYGSLYFRQDQPHIDLFVFFSVFFSCFFLFLAMCVLLWKTKQAFDARRSRQQRAREMLHMASRPFAKVLVLIEHSSPFNISPNLNLLRSVKNTARTPLLPSETSLPSSPIIVRHSFDIIPIAIEPTDDGVAGVVTVVFQLPGGSQAPTHLCLGSTLTKGYQLSHTSGKHRRLPNSSQC